MNIGIIGVGKLGLSLLFGFIKAGYPKNNIYVFDKSKHALEKAMSLEVYVSNTLDELIVNSDVIIISVRPNDTIALAREIARSFTENKKIVSTAAFVSLRALEEVLGIKNVYRAMPNIAAEVNSSFTALSPPSRRDSDIEKLFSYIGVVEWVEEEVLNALTIMSSSIPAIIAELIDAFILASLRAGIPLDVARKSIATVFQGVGKLVEQKELYLIRNTVTTPGGTTIRLLEKFYKYGVKNNLILALIDSYEEYIKKLNEYR